MTALIYTRHNFSIRRRENAENASLKLHLGQILSNCNTCLQVEVICVNISLYKLFGFVECLLVLGSFDF
jgi:hypothetical protein